MNRIDDVFKKKGKAFITYITAGYPDMRATESLVPALEKAGTDIIELGVPFSDPIADGKTIQMASQHALTKRADIASILKMVARVRKGSGVPIVLMTYYNPVFRYGTERFVKDCLRSGVDGVIIPDLPPEESESFIRFSGRKDFAVILLIAPTSTPLRIKKICSKSTGFVYYVSITGVTGARKALPPQVSSKLKKIKGITKKPVCVGFGVSSPRQAALLAKAADGVIVGSAVIDAISKNMGRDGGVKAASRLVKRLAKAVHRA